MDATFHVEHSADGKAELGILTHEGHEFSALGSVIDHDAGVVVGYPKGFDLMTWDGTTVIGRVRVVSSYPMPQSWQGSTMYCYRAVIEGRHYYGRGFGDGMLLRLRACKRPR